MPNPMYFQSIMMALQKFWAEKGCLIWQPYYSQVGAGTMNPATFLRVLGPEPWNVGYVEPSIRPDDGRYGDNPYRLQQHYQFQVILKPDPGNPQELYLQSLQALGIQPQEHDIRFVEDNWESPALGAWGLGWEVWLDGQEITQFTYFQQAGGINLEPVSVELTYGLERIAMALQGNYHFRNILWNPDYTYGDVNYQAEKEHSTYYFEKADIERVREMFRLFEEEANLALDMGLVLPAHDYILKCSHTFNILDTRGSVGVTERQALFGRMRDLSRRTAEVYIQQRESLGYPWLEKPSLAPSAKQPESTMPQLALPPAEEEATSADFLLEIGTEELPAGDLKSALEQLHHLAPSLFEDLHLPYESLEISGTPRRLTLQVKNLASRQEDQTVQVKGPPADHAYDQNDKPSQAVIGFARSKGVQVEDLQKAEMENGVYLVAQVHHPGSSIFTVLPEKLAALIAELHFEKSMRWNASGVSFSRPIRWLIALFGSRVIPFHYAGLDSGRITHGLRFSQNETVELGSVTDYAPYLASQGIITDPKVRREHIREQVANLLASLKSSEEIDETLLDEVTNLVEAPTALLGHFDKSHLQLPAEILVGVMKKHQRYFPVRSLNGSLMPYFITVRNGGKAHLDSVARGNEEVIGARFADAAFFMQDDSKHKLEDFLPRLDTLIFHPKLGSMLNKTRRIVALTGKLAEQIQLSPDQRAIALEAAELCKADLPTKMVVEMTSLQGIIGKYYALRDGKNEETAQAIQDHYLPRGAGDGSPQGMPALVVGLADRLDSITGLFAAGMAPSGAKDPFGLRRAAISLVQNLIDREVEIDLRESISHTSDLLPVKTSAQDHNACLEFIRLRLENLLLEQGYRHDVVRAVLAEQGHNPVQAVCNIRELTQWVADENWALVLAAYARCVRITRDQKECFPVVIDRLIEPQEKSLYKAAQKVRSEIGDSRGVDVFLSAFSKMIPQIDRFFDTVLVMDENIEIRQNRLGLLQEIVHLADGKADFSKLEGF